MPDFESIRKSGWHPKGKDGKSKESWRGDFKGVDQIAGWMGKGKSTSSVDAANDHVSRPLAALKDPAAFGPPPKNVNYHGGAALPNQITPDTRGLGAPLSRAEIEAKQEAEAQEAEKVAKPKGPPVPFRADTTGLSTSNLPLPPARKDGADGRSPTLSSNSRPTPPPPGQKDRPDGRSPTFNSNPRPTPPPPGRKDGMNGRSSTLSPTSKPTPPPRLPPRQNSALSTTSTVSTSTPQSNGTNEPGSHRGILNNDSLDRLGAAGVSVPAFGIGGKEPLRSSSRSQATAHGVSSDQTETRSSSTGPTSNSQLHELQAKFSRLNKPSDTATEAAPTQGTTWAQKQAALKTASSFRNNPSSVSLGDARAAASTANNFRERHGDQVSAGLRSANSINSRYGLVDKVGKYTSPAIAPGSEAVETPSTTSVESRGNELVVKKTAPPPPKKKANLGIVADAGEGAPPLPLASKPKPRLLSFQPSIPKADLDLDLQLQWFAKSPAAFPPPTIANLPGSRAYASSMGWTSSGSRRTHTFNAIIRHNTDLSTTKLHLTWDANDPARTVRAEQRHIPPPRLLSSDELEIYRSQYSDRIAGWCESKMGMQVGNGECWTLAAEALKAIAAEDSSRGVEPCMSSQGVTHGYAVYKWLPPQSQEPPGGIEASLVARGDIAQFLSAHFRRKDGRGESWAGAPDHTAVITKVERGGILSVVQSNTGGVKKVKEGRYDFSELVNGEIRIFRAVGESWAGPLDPSWP